MPLLKSLRHHIEGFFEIPQMHIFFAKVETRAVITVGHTPGKAGNGDERTGMLVVRTDD